MNECFKFFKSLLLCFNAFGVRRSIDVLDPENHPGSGSGLIVSGSGELGLTEDGWHQKYEIKKEGFKKCPIFIQLNSKKSPFV